VRPAFILLPFGLAVAMPILVPSERNGRRIRQWAALDDVLAGRPVGGEQIPSIGCNIKWRTGNEPDYF
jgi:hypothetical protein